MLNVERGKFNILFMMGLSLYICSLMVGVQSPFFPYSVSCHLPAGAVASPTTWGNSGIDPSITNLELCGDVSS